MNLADFLLKMKMPQHSTLISGGAAGTVTLSHPKTKIITEKGLEELTKSEFHTEYVAFLGVLLDNRGATFFNLYFAACNKYGFPDHGPIMDRHLQVLEAFSKMGAVNIDGKVGSGTYGNVQIFGMPERAGNAKFSLNRYGLEQIEVLSAMPSNKSKARNFRRYFPRVS